MKYKIISKKGDNTVFWSSHGWQSSQDNAEWLDDADLDVMMRHFKDRKYLCAITEDQVFNGWHLTGMGMIS